MSVTEAVIFKEITVLDVIRKAIDWLLSDFKEITFSDFFLKEIDWKISVTKEVEGAIKVSQKKKNTFSSRNL